MASFLFTTFAYNNQLWCPQSRFPNCGKFNIYFFPPVLYYPLPLWFTYGAVVLWWTKKSLRQTASQLEDWCTLRLIDAIIIKGQ